MDLVEVIHFMILLCILIQVFFYFKNTQLILFFGTVLKSNHCLTLLLPYGNIWHGYTKSSMNLVFCYFIKMMSDYGRVHNIAIRQYIL